MSDDGAFFIGDVAMDEYYRATHWPAHGTKLTLQPAGNHPGGMIANAAAVYAGYGESAHFCWAMNSSPTTEALLADLEAAGVGTRHVVRDGALGDSKCIIVLTEGDHTVLVPDIGLTRIALSDEILAAMLRAKSLYTAIGDLRMLTHGNEGAVEILQRLQKAGVKVVLDLDVGELKPGDGNLLPHVDTLFVNQLGFGRLAAGRSEADTVRSILDAGTTTLVVTRGPGGCDVHTADADIHIPGVTVDVVDVTGAGDTFGASYLHAIGRVGSPELAAAFANAAAARAVTATGARAGITTDADVLSFIHTHQILSPDKVAQLEVELAAGTRSG